MAAVVKPLATAPNPPAARDALAYLRRCVEASVACAVLTSDDDALRQDLLDELVNSGRQVGKDHWVTVDAPTDSPLAFHEAILSQLGYELQDGDVETIQSLFQVFLRHEIRGGRRLIVIMDGAQEFGPRVLDHLDQILRVRYRGTTAVTLVLSGSQALNRVLDSPGMLRLADATRERFDLEHRGLWLARAPRPEARLTPSPAAGASHSLVVMLRGEEIRRVPLPSGRMVVGRSRQCDLRLGARWVSRHHALVLVTAGAAFIVDLGSTNGTRVNGAVVRQQALRPGDVVEIGGFRLRYECTTPA